MKCYKTVVLSLMIGAGLSFAALAADRESSARLTAKEKAEILDTLSKQLKIKYVFPEAANHIALEFATKSAQGGYDKAETPVEFAELLSQDLRKFGNDRHFRVRFDPSFQPEPEGSSVPSDTEMAKERADEARSAWGIATVQRLPGNVGYLDLRGFGQDEIVAPAYTSAMSLLAGTDALIVDLRRNGGGSPGAVAFFMSHFFAFGDERHLNDIYERPKDQTRAFWTNPAASVRYTKPVYVLISARTFSGGEECAYDFQTQKRAKLVGEVTGGGANPGEPYELGHGLVAFIPTGRAINPITHTNWEHIGVKPDIEVPAANALQRAYTETLRLVVAKETDHDKRDALEKVLVRVEKGEPEPIDYSRRP